MAFRVASHITKDGTTIHTRRVAPEGVVREQRPVTGRTFHALYDVMAATAERFDYYVEEARFGESVALKPASTARGPAAWPALIDELAENLWTDGPWELGFGFPSLSIDYPPKDVPAVDTPMHAALAAAVQRAPFAHVYVGTHAPGLFEATLVERGRSKHTICVDLRDLAATAAAAATVQHLERIAALGCIEGTAEIYLTPADPAGEVGFPSFTAEQVAAFIAALDQEPRLHDRRDLSVSLMLGGALAFIAAAGGTGLALLQHDWSFVERSMTAVDSAAVGILGWTAMHAGLRGQRRAPLPQAIEVVNNPYVMRRFELRAQDHFFWSAHQVTREGPGT